MTKSRGVGRGFGGGRPTSYKAEYNQLATNYCLRGATNAQLAELLEVNLSTVDEWIKTIPRFASALKAGREIADARVASALFRKALDGDTVACIFWLKNRRPEEWKDQRDLKHSGMVTLAALISGEEEPTPEKAIKQIEASREDQ